MHELSGYKNVVRQGRDSWDDFLLFRDKKLMQVGRDGGGAEKITETIIDNLLTQVLDWCPSNVNYQIEYSDIMLTHMGLKKVIIELKRPHSFTGNDRAFRLALDQARKYADRQKVRAIAVSDGVRLYVADIVDSNLSERISVHLDDRKFPEELFLLSVHGVNKKHNGPQLRLNLHSSIGLVDELIHPKYKLPSRCFAYAGDSTDTKTWKLPILKIDGSVDTKRLPGAIRCILSNYRGKNVQGIPENSISFVLNKLYEAAKIAKKLPSQNKKTADTYKNLDHYWHQKCNTPCDIV